MRRLLALLMCIAVPAAGFGALHHEATEVHAVCAEHGHLIHEDAGETAGWNAADTPHEGCGLEQIAPQAAAEGAGPGVAERPSPVDEPRSRAAPRVRVGDRAILAYAPKTSPPLV